MKQRVEHYWGVRIGREPKDAPYLMVTLISEDDFLGPQLYEDRADAMAAKKALDSYARRSSAVVSVKVRWPAPKPKRSKPCRKD